MQLKNKFTKNVKILLILALVAHLLLLLLTKFTAWPEMLTWPYQLLEGWRPYQDIAIVHTPLLIVILSAFYKIVGVGIFQLQIFTWIVALASTFLAWIITKKLWGPKVAIIAAFIYPLYHIFYEGNGLWFDLLLAPLFLFIYYLIRNKSYIAAGIIFAASLFTKQTAIWIVIPVFIDLFLSGSRKIWELEKRYIPFLYGAVLIILFGTIVMYLSGILPYFTHWAIEFGILTLPMLPGQIALPDVTEFMKSIFPLTPLLILVLLSRDKKTTTMLLWSIFASFGVYPRWELFHFQPAIPFMVVGTALLVDRATRIAKITARQIVIFVTLFLVLVLFARSFIRSCGSSVRFYDKTIEEVVASVQLFSKNSDGIYVINYWDSVYALSDRKPVTKPLVPYIPWYLEYQDLGEYIALQVRSTLPAVIVRGDYEDGLSSYRIEFLEDTIDRYYVPYYSKSGVTVYLRN